ncbi:MAG: hypothetical protein ACE5EL_07380 [Anaerolineae bacterium]
MADEAAWDRTVASFRTELETFQALVAAPDADLLAPLPHAPDCTLLREALVLADHNAYHIGEFAVLRSVMGTWPADRDEAT